MAACLLFGSSAMAQAMSLAELDSSYKPTLKTQFKVNVAKGEAACDVSKQKCDDLSG